MLEYLVLLFIFCFIVFQVVNIFLSIRQAVPINSWYGIRTRNSMKNTENWNLAQIINSRFSVVSVAVSILVFILILFLPDKTYSIFIFLILFDLLIRFFSIRSINKIIDK